MSIILRVEFVEYMGEHMIKIAICDDEKNMLERLKILIEAEYRKLQQEVEIYCYSSGEEFLEGYAEKKHEVVFLDVYLPQISGFQVATRMNQKKNNTYIIFITSNSELVFQCFDYKPFNFISKAIYEIKVPIIIAKLSKVMKQNDILCIECKDKQYNIPYYDIIYVKSDNHYVLIHTVKYDYNIRIKLSDLYEKLKDYDFIIVHRKNIINLRYLNVVDSSLNEVALSDGTRLEMSRNYKNDVKKAYAEYMRSTS